jgi:hypothetical protein
MGNQDDKRNGKPLAPKLKKEPTESLSGIFVRLGTKDVTRPGRGIVLRT